MLDSQGDSVGPTRICRIVYDDGTAVEVEMTIALANAIERMERNEARYEREHRQHMKPFSNLEIDGNLLITAKPARGPKAPRYPGRPWEGPIFQFTLLVGVGKPWHGPTPVGEPCRFCSGIKLQPIAVCLACTRSGRDRDIPRPTAAELRVLREAKPRTGGLPGGLGSTKPVKAKTAPRAKP